MGPVRGRLGKGKGRPEWLEWGELEGYDADLRSVSVRRHEGEEGLRLCEVRTACPPSDRLLCHGVPLLEVREGASARDKSGQPSRSGNMAKWRAS
jgi:hypothetical protein